MGQLGAAVRTMTTQEGISIVNVPEAQRTELEWILNESFEGWYLMHSMRTLHRIETVRAALSSGKPVGLVMLKVLDGIIGYVYYIAVAKSQRQKGIAKLLLEDSLGIFKAKGVKEVFASVEHENVPSEKLFASQGFVPTSFGEVAKNYGNIHTVNMYRIMTVVPGEVLLHKILE